MSRIRLPYPHQGQRIVREQAKRHNVLAAGRRWRKTTLCMSIAVESAARYGEYVWAAPTYDQVRIGWEETRRAGRSSIEFTQQSMTATLPNGGKIIYRSLDDPEHARGHTGNGLVIDEAADVKERAWYEVMRPVLMDTGGWSWLIGTPKGHNWFWREFEAAKTRDDSMAWQAPTLGVEITAMGLIRKPHPLENPNIPFEEIVNLWKTMPERSFGQEILAEFIEDAGGVFRRVLAAATLQPQDEPTVGHQYVMGVDWGKANDWTVITVWDATDKALVALDRFNQIDYAFQMERLRVLVDRWRPDCIRPEVNSMGEPLVEQLQREGLPVVPFVTTNASKAAAVEALALAFERGDIHIINDATLIAELQAFEMSRTVTGMTRYAAPEGMHDDMVMSAVFGYSAIAETGPLLL